MHVIRMSLAAAGSLLLAAGLAQAQHHGHMQATADARVLVKYPPDLIEHTLANMRDHLLAVQEITVSLAQGQTDKAAKIAEGRLGMTSLPLHGAQDVAPFMPQAMQDAGSAMHRAASRFAIEATDAGVSGDLKPAVAALGEVLGACNSCHAQFKLR